MHKSNKYVTYKLYRGGRTFNLSKLDGDADSKELLLVPRILKSIFKSDTHTINLLEYCAASGQFAIGMPGGAVSSNVVMQIDRINPKIVIAVAEICAMLRCRLVPSDGGPDVDPSAEALGYDIGRRALAWVRPAGKSMHEMMLLDLVLG